MANFSSDAATWRTGRKIRVVSDSGPFIPLPGMRKPHLQWPEVHNVFHCRQKRITEPQIQIIFLSCTENLVTFGHAVFEQTDKQTDKQTQARWSQYCVHLPLGTGGSNHVSIVYNYWITTFYWLRAYVITNGLDRKQQLKL